MSELRAETQRKLEEKIKFVELIKKTHADFVVDSRAIIKKMKAQAEMLKRKAIKMLEDFRDKLNALYARDSINKEADEIIERFKAQYPFGPDDDDE